MFLQGNLRHLRPREYNLHRKGSLNNPKDNLHQRDSPNNREGNLNKHRKLSQEY
jgi:hypothetical protein